MSEQDQDSAKRRIAEISALLSEFAAGISHEINNPLSIIHGSSMRLKRLNSQGKIDQENLEKGLQRINESSERIAKIIQNLKSFAQDSSNDPHTVENLNELLNQSLQFFRGQWENHGVKVQVSLPFEELFVLCRPNQIQRAIFAIIRNAQDAIKSVSGERWLKIHLFTENSQCKLRISDSGPGISKEDRSKIFQAFFTTKDTGEGSGLGLSMAQGLLEENNGSIRLLEEEDHTTFELTLPQVAEYEEAA